MCCWPRELHALRPLTLRLRRGRAVRAQPIRLICAAGRGTPGLAARLASRRPDRRA
jgi:hypothetical protein